jgi:putative salt-induced outer membrane protein YdiY
VIRMMPALVLALWAAWAAGAAEIELISGERLEGRIAERSAESIILEHAILGRLEIPRAAIRSIDGRPLSPADEQAPRRAPETEAEEQEAEEGAEASGPSEPPPPPPGPDKEIQWDATLELGFAAREGTTDEASLRSGLRISRTTAGHEFRYDATYRLATARGDRTENRFSTGFFSEWEKTERGWTAFVQGRFDAAEFQAWDQRLTAAGGAGHRLLDVKGVEEEGHPVDVFTLIGRLGGGLRKEFGSLDEELAPEGLLGAEFAWRVSPDQAITGDATLYPDLNDTREFRLVSRLDWTINIDRMDGISLRLGLTHEYESRTRPGVAHSDLSAYGALVIDF